VRTTFKMNRSGEVERGSILLIAAASISVLFAFMGLALDASYMYFHKRSMQTAADAGAYAGAWERLRGNTTEISAAAKHDTSLNGFTDAVNNVTVSVNSPPVTGSKAGNAAFVEVIISDVQPTWFMRILNFNSVNVKARAVAGIGNAAGCVYALNRDSSNVDNGFSANGGTTVNFGCGIYSNANFRASNNTCVNVPSVSYTGTYTNGSSCGPSAIGQGVPVVDPMLGKFTMPATSPCDYNNFKITGGLAVVLLPGVYCGGISISGSVTSVLFSPGSYVLAGGGMSVNGSVLLSGFDVTFFNTYPGSQTNKYAGISINGSGTVDLSAPTAGPYKGLLFYQDPSVAWASNNGSIMAGSSSSAYQGILYFPTTDVTYTGNSSATGGADGYTTLIGYNIKVSGNSQINADYSLLGGSNPLQNAVFAE
jgi:hypothetical protein